ncbi:hypothetical protein HDU83_007853 [Entophlyctis luteolus]|nr:hypothetical protein HDU83_007853 [Entophlyctis luteolus]
MSDQLKSYEAKISILQSQLDSCRSMPRSSTPSGGKRDEQTSLSSMEETVSLTEHLAVKEELRQLRRQHKRAGATVRELETQVEHLAAELSQRRSAAPSLQSSPQTGASRILHSAEDVEDTRRAQQDLLQFVRELSAANARLASELRDSQMQCQKAQVQVANLTTLVEQLENNDIESTADLYALDISPSKEHEFVPNSLAHELWNVTTKQTPQMKRISVSIVESLSDRDDLTDTSSVSSAMFNNNMGNNQIAALDSSSVRSAKVMRRISAPIGSVASGGRLRRAFDIKELTRLSHSVLSNIEADITNLSQRFPSAPTASATGGRGLSALSDVATVVAPTVALVQMLLADVAAQRRVSGELALAYYEAVKRRAEDDAAVAATSVGDLSGGIGGGMGNRSGSTSSSMGAFANTVVTGLGRTIHRVLSDSSGLFAEPAQASQHQQRLQQDKSRRGIATKKPLHEKVEKNEWASATRARVITAMSDEDSADADENSCADDLFFDPPPDHPYWRTTAAAAAAGQTDARRRWMRARDVSRGIEEAGVGEIPPRDHPYWAP